MNRQRLIIKRPSGWFAAGREFAQALELLSDGAFKVFVHACLCADRHTARVAARAEDLGAALGKQREMIEVHLTELVDQGVCHIDSGGTLEISDRFWPYQKQNQGHDTDREKTAFIRRVRVLFLEPRCVQATFSAGDDNFAARLYERGVSLEQVRRAILLGCARKYVAMINHQIRQPITSLQYFGSLVDEVLEGKIPESYWEPLRRKHLEMESQWLDVKRQHCLRPSPE